MAETVNTSVPAWTNLTTVASTTTERYASGSEAVDVTEAIGWAGSNCLTAMSSAIETPVVDATGMKK